MKFFKKKKMALTDSSKMPFGIFKYKKMKNVPAWYLLWIFESNKCTPEVAFYIRDNLEKLKEKIENEL